MDPKSGQKSDVYDLLTADFERPHLNKLAKSALAKCNITVHVATAHCFTVVDKLKACKVPTLEISDATRIKDSQLLNISSESYCSSSTMNEMAAVSLISIVRWSPECLTGQFQPARSSTFPASSPQRLTQIGSNLVYTLLLRSCLLC